MKETVTKHSFISSFTLTRPDSFTYEGLECLFEYLESLKTELDAEFEFDVIALCAEYKEWGNISEYNDYYCTDYESMDDLDSFIPVEDGRFITRLE